jgi:hypothetical protein
MFDRFIFECVGRRNSDGSQGKLYKCSDMSKYSFIGVTQIYVGTWYSGVLSAPESSSRLEDYTHFTVEIIGPKSSMLRQEDFLIEDNLKQKLYNHNTAYHAHDICRFDLIPVSLLKELYNELYTVSGIQPELKIKEVKPREVKTGGNCCVCGAYDKYAPETNGKFYCYLHFKM